MCVWHLRSALRMWRSLERQELLFLAPSTFGCHTSRRPIHHFLKLQSFQIWEQRCGKDLQEQFGGTSISFFVWCRQTFASGKRQTRSKTLTFLMPCLPVSRKGRTTLSLFLVYLFRLWNPSARACLCHTKHTEPSLLLVPWNALDVWPIPHPVPMIAMSHQDKGREKGILTLFYSNRSHPERFPADITNSDI